MGAYAVPKFPAGGSITGHAAAALTGGRFAIQNATVPNGGCPVVGVPGAGVAVDYVIGEDAASGSKVLLHRPGQVCWVEAGATLAAKDLVETNASGQAIVRSAGVVAGRVIQGATVGLPALIDFRPAFL